MMASLPSALRVQRQTKTERVQKTVNRHRCQTIARAAAPTYTVTFVNVGKGKETSVPCSSDDVLLDVADHHGIAVPSSCRGGVCGSCVSKLVQGTVDQGWLCDLDDGSALTPEQIAAGFILLCSAKPSSDVTVEYSQEWGLSTLEEWNAAHSSA